MSMSMQGNTGNVARPAVRSSSSPRALAEISEMEAKKRALKRRIKCGVLSLTIFDAILSLSGIVLTYWWPGLSFASALSTFFTGVLLLFIVEKRVKMSNRVLLGARLRLITSFLSFAVSSYEGIWSILLTVGSETKSSIPLYLMIAALVAYALHFFSLVSNVVITWASTNAEVLPQQLTRAASLPQYKEVKPAPPVQGNLMRNNSGLPQYDDLV